MPAPDTLAQAPLPVQTRAALTVCLLQFVFTLGWTVYVIFLPGLLAKVGIDKSWLLWLLLADQLAFAAMDVWAGFAADKVMRTVGRLGPWLLALAGLSALAFLLLPWVPGALPAAMQAPVLLVLIFLWVLTSSAMRAPPLIMLQKYASGPRTPWLLAMYLAGLALAGAFAPYLTVALKKADPALPFAVASLSLIATVLGLLHAERQLAATQNATAATAASAASAATTSPRPGAAPWGLWGIGLLLGLAFQNHFSLNAAPQFLRFATPADLEWLMPVFWIGFNLILLAEPLLAKRFGHLQVMVTGALLGALGSAFCATAPALAALIGAQLLAGAGWGLLLISAIGFMLTRGGVGREGLFLGGFFSMLALSAAARIALVISKLPASGEWRGVLPWSPAGLWLASALLLLLLWRKTRAQN